MEPNRKIEGNAPTSPIPVIVKRERTSSYIAVAVAVLGELWALVKIENGVGWWAIFTVFVATMLLLAAMSDV